MKIPAIKGFDQEALTKYFKNTGWLMLARVGSLAIKIFVGFALSNYLGDKHYGMLNFPVAFTSFFIAIGALGLDGFITRELLRTPDERDRLLGTSFFMKVGGALLVLPLIWLAYAFYNDRYGTETPADYFIITGLVGLAQAFNVLDSYFQSKVQGKWVMMVQVFGNIASALVKLLLILNDMPLSWFIYAVLFDAVLLAAGYIYFYRREVGSLFSWKFDARLARRLISNSWPLAFSAVLVSIYMKIDQLMIEAYMGPAPLGVYSTVVTLSESWYFIPVAIVTSVFPAIMNARRDDPQRYQRRLQNMYDLMVWISLALAIFMTFASPYIYRIVWHDKPEFWAGAPVLSVHIWAGVFTFLAVASGQYLIAEGFTRLTIVRTAAGALVNVCLNIIWIPVYGMMGAAMSTLAAYFTATFFLIFLPSTHKQAIMMLKSLFLITLVQKAFGFLKQPKP
ncbi:flippase [Pedobacter sp. SYP-B3415]|uniref:flippase n=1 Tax=Pedobacter sp. SYP-B3415 TaxID=2496641 RepID=UPI00101C7A21|nr:flippase [Pedobacter sp. SYP-B3415]